MNMIARITEYCVRKDIISSSDAEWFSYGLVQRSEKLIAICFLFPLGCLLSSFSTSLVFYLSFFLLRTHTNGYHAKTSAGCLLFSICSECVLFLLILPYLKGSASLWILTLSTIIIFWLAPYDHPNLHMTKEELAASRRMARLTVLILDMALILSLGAKFYAFANGITLGLGFTAFLLIVAHGKQKYEKGDIGIYIQFAPVSVMLIRKEIKERSHSTRQIGNQIVHANLQAIYNKLAKVSRRENLPILRFFFCLAICCIAVIVAAPQSMQAASSGIRLKHVGFGYVICRAGIIIDQVQQLFVDLLARRLLNWFCR